MTPTQELANTVSMALPTAVLAWNAWACPGEHAFVLLVGSLVHLPVSFVYHVNVARNVYADRLDNNMRRLDQSMQHVVGTLFSYALSGSVGYMALNLALNLYGLYRLWDKNTSNDGRRWIPVLFCVFLYTTPMLWRNDLCNYALAAGSMAFGGALFVPELNSRYFRGWGHSLFHVVLVVYAQALANSAGKLSTH